MWPLLLAAITMAFKDGVLTCLTIAEAKNRPVLAGALDALGDIAVILTTIVGAGLVIQHGWTWHSAEILAAMCATSFLGTIGWTKLGHRLADGKGSVRGPVLPASES